MEGEAMVSYSTGSMNSLVDKLTKLKNRHQIVQELEGDLVRLKEGFFGKLLGRTEMNTQIKAWMVNVRELVYDIEDWTDQQLAMPDMGDQPEIEEEIKKFIAQIKEARERFTSYNLVVEVPNKRKATDAASSEIIHDSPLISGGRFGLVAVQYPTNELVNHLTDRQEKMLKVVSILGMEGLGKTTLAKKIYSEIQGQFDCHAFVTVGRRPSMIATLMNILRQVKPKTDCEGGRRTALDLQEAITELWEYLGEKRYFIIVDGLWSTRAWKIINCSLPNKNRGSRVLTTTCINAVAKCCSVRPSDVHPIKALSEENSRSLYLQSTPKQIRPAGIGYVSSHMLKICRGMPLAISVAAGLLEMNSQELTELKMSEKSILSSPEQCSTSEGMIKILHMSYASLSRPLKSCFLYLNAFREDYIIKKDRLIGLWEAEGFIPRKGEESVWETGERFFNELIIRGLIEPVFDWDDDQAVGCTVHGIIINFIRSLSNECNFVTVGADLCSGLFPGSTNTIRRFSLDCYNDEEDDDTLATSIVHLSRVRSLTVLGDVEGMGGRSALAACWETEGTSLFRSLKLIRVLDLEDNDNLRSCHLVDIGELVLLKYLGLRGTSIDTLPEQDGKLVQLETLDVRQTNLRTLPESIVALKRLRRLLVDSAVQVNLFLCLHEMKGLEEVSTIRADGIGLSVSVGMPGGALDMLMQERLRVLSLDFTGVADLGEARTFLARIPTSHIRSLSLHHIRADFVNLLPLATELSKLEVRLSDPGSGGQSAWLAHGLGGYVLVTHMHIEVIDSLEHSVGVLGIMPQLIFLNLVSREIKHVASIKKILSPSGLKIAATRIKGRTRRRGTNGRCVIHERAFRCLKVLRFTCKDGGAELEFAPGSMPRLERLGLSFSARKTLSLYGDFEFGIQHLTGLMLVHATISCEGATATEVEEAEAAIREQARQNSTTVQFSRELEDRMVKEDVKGVIKRTSSHKSGQDCRKGCKW